MGPIWLRLVVVIFIIVLVLDDAGQSYGCWDQDRNALFQLKSFFNLNQGGEDSDCCQWNSVECNITSRRVTKLSLAGEGYSELINVSLFLPFEELRSLDLGYNRLVGCVENEGFEKLSKLRHLEILDLSGNYFNYNILSSLSKISTLKSLSLSYNDLSTRSNNTNGKVIMFQANMMNKFLLHLGALSSLKTLIFAGNNLAGTVNLREFCALSNLETLDLSFNEISQFETSKENICLRKLKFLLLDGVSTTKGSTSLVSLLKPFSSVKTLFFRGNSYLNKTVVTQELHVLSKVENLFLDDTPLDINFLKSIGTLTSLKTLSLSNCSLVGPLPAQGWCDLKSLEELNFKGNALRGAIASCLGNLTFLRYLDISNNQFTGNIASTPFTNLSMLQFLSLSKNQFQVPMSFKSFANQSDLEVLFADENKLVVEPTTFQTWSPKFQLRAFVLSNCRIDEQGKLQLPNFLYYQYDLRYIDFSNCDFGRIRFPDWLIENNTGLQELHMVNSSIVGPLLLPSHPNTNLVIFDISNNKIQHEIPRNFCSLFPYLEDLNMSQNAFKSNIPLCLGGMTMLSSLDMSHNKFFGGFPKELAMSNSLTFLRLSNNSLRGKSLPAIHYLPNRLKQLFLDGNKFEGEIPTISSASLQVLDVSDNCFFGKLPGWLWNQTNLGILDLSKNNFEGLIPMELCNLVQLEFLDLSQNYLSGTIPSCSNLEMLKHVHLSKNKLSGQLSHAFYGSSSLVTLDLSENNLIGRIPDWIGTLQALSVLLLKANHFHGEFPIHLCKLQSLSILDLSQNKLCGAIPSCLNNLTLKPSVEKSSISSGTYYFLPSNNVIGDMGLAIYDLANNNSELGSRLVSLPIYPDNYAEEKIEFSTKNAVHTYKGNILALLSGVDLSCNQLTGVIPPELGDLSEIRGLNLSHNNLTGLIPSTFSKLKQIESLDLSFNNLNGRIPPQLTELTFLAIFTVAHNNLSGPLPDRKAQFETFDESSYEGNPLLCGLPLNNSCNEGDSPRTPGASASEEEHGLIDMGDFYICFAVSYAVILLATAIVLYINPYWRQAWFYLVEDISITCYFFVVDRLHRLLGFRRNM